MCHLIIKVRRCLEPYAYFTISWYIMYSLLEYGKINLVAVRLLICIECKYLIRETLIMK